jgi:hypothetical protein
MPTLNVASERSTTASASTVGGTLDAVHTSLAGFVAAGPDGKGSADG